MVGRYLTGTANRKRKFITFEEIKNLESAGLRVFPIYQDGGYKVQYFQNVKQGIEDAHTAITAAKRIGVPKGTTIYFAVDFDCYDYQMKSFIVPYFKKLNLVFDSETNNKKYKVGIYAPRYICSYISKKGLAEYSFVADMSSGYSCNLGYPIPKNWAFDQFFEFNVNNGGQFPSSPSFDLDKAGYSGRDKGITTFDKMPYMSPDQLAEKNSNIILDIQRDQYVYNVFEPLGYLDKVYNSSLTYKKEFLLDTILLNGLTIKITAEVSDTLTTNFDSTPITIDLNNEGELTASCEAEIEGMIAGMEIKDFKNIDIINSTINDLKDVAKSVTSGQIGVKVNLNGTYPKLTFVITTEDIFPDSAAVDQEITVEISFEIIPNPTPDVDYKLDKTTLAKCAISAAAVIVLIAFLSNPGTAPLAPGCLTALGVLA